MKVLFICSGGTRGEAGAVVSNQAETLIDKGIDLEIFLINGKGIKGYLSSVRKLRRVIREKNPDIFHAHYLWSGVVSSLAGCKPLVVSIMGSDLYSSVLNRVLIRFFNLVSWNQVIVKSDKMYYLLKIKSALVIPNGVNTKIFKPHPESHDRKRSGTNRKVLFLGRPERPEKNYNLAVAAVKELEGEGVVLLNHFDKTSVEVAELINEVDLLLLTSIYEGSPNVLKEAMACNCPVVTTDVGDARLLLDNIEGSCISPGNVTDLANSIRKVLKQEGHSAGRKRIFELGLDSDTISEALIKVYESKKLNNK